MRRTAIKDLFAYCAFLLGFLGSAPFAWKYLALELERGNLAQGLWYFFGIVFAAGLFAGTAGLAAGFVIGWVWERYHRRRRRERQKRRELEEKGKVDTAPATPADELAAQRERKRRRLTGF